MTGELYQTTEITPDGRNPSFARDGSVMFETGPANAPITRIIGFPGVRTVAEFAGRGAVTDAALKNIAYMTSDGGLVLRMTGSDR